MNLKNLLYSWVFVLGECLDRLMVWLCVFLRLCVVLIEFVNGNAFFDCRLKSIVCSDCIFLLKALKFYDSVVTVEILLFCNDKCLFLVYNSSSKWWWLLLSIKSSNENYLNYLKGCVYEYCLKLKILINFVLFS